jgi:hypothetical protein
MSSHHDSPSFMKVLVTVAFFVIVLPLIVFRGSCVEQEVALHAVQVEGYTDAKVVDRHNVFAGWQGCAGEDAVGFDVEATNVKGERVKLLVCAGWWLKAATVRVR